MLTVGLWKRCLQNMFYFAGVPVWASKTVGCDLSETKTSGRVIRWPRPDYLMLCRYKDAPVGWSLETSLGHASHYIFVFVLMSPSCPRSSSRRIRATFCLLSTIEPFLPWYFHNVFLKGSVHACAHILWREPSTARARARVSCSTPYLILLCLLKESERFARHSLRFSKYAPHPFFSQDYECSAWVLTCGSLSDTVNLKYVFIGADKQWEALRCRKVVQHWLIFGCWRNVSGWTGRIPQSCVTRSLHWREPDTYLSIRCCSGPLPFSNFAASPILLILPHRAKFVLLLLSLAPSTFFSFSNLLISLFSYTIYTYRWVVLEIIKLP